MSQQKITQVLKAFTVVHFEDDSVEVVPSTWITEDQQHCSFPDPPPKGFKKLQRAVGSEPEETWEKFPCKCIKSYGRINQHIYFN